MRRSKWSELSKAAVAGVVIISVIGVLTHLKQFQPYIDSFRKGYNDEQAQAHGDPPPCTAVNCGTGQPASQADPSVWSVSYETNPDSPISGKKILIARATHAMADGGRIDIQATCADEQSLAFEFVAFGKSGDGAAYEYSAPDNNGGESYLTIIYRIDSGDQLLIANTYSTTRYANVAQAGFSYAGPNYQPADLDKADAEAKKTLSSDSLLAKILVGTMQLSTLVLQAQQPQDIIAFLNGQSARFQFPLKGGHKEIVEIQPHDPSFQQFVAQCHINSQQLEQRHIADQAAQNPPPDDATQPQTQQPDQGSENVTTPNGAQPSSSLPMNVQSAIYGSPEIGKTCDAISSVARTCNGQATCSVIANNDLCGDPNFGIKKLLTVRYRCGERGVRTVSAPETSEAQLTCQ
jgi:hypothetical protein